MTVSATPLSRPPVAACLSVVKAVLLTALVALLVTLLTAVRAPAGDVAPFIGDYSGTAEVETSDGQRVSRDMSVSIRAEDEGFSVRWTTATRRDGESREKTYRIEFQSTARPDVYAAAMTRNVFGHEGPLDPMKGEPYVWARIEGDTLTVFSLFVTDSGGYELQQFDRTLADGGLMLDFSRIRDGVPQRSIETFLTRN